MKLIVSTLSGSKPKDVKELTTLEDLEKILKATEMICNHVGRSPMVIMEKWKTIDNEWHLTVIDDDMF